MKKITFILTLLILSWSGIAFSQSQQPNNQVTFSTFTAAPIAHYHHIRLHPNDDLGDPCTPGTVYFSSLQNDLVYCQDDGTGTGAGTFGLLGGSIWKKVGNDIYPGGTASNPNLKVGIGTSKPLQSLDIANGNHIRFDSHSGHFFWMSEVSNLGIGPTDVTSKLHHNNVLVNLNAVSAALQPVTDARFTIVGGTTIIGALDHNHVPAGGGGGGGPVGPGGGQTGPGNVSNMIFTVVGDSDFVGESYFHDDVFMEGDLNVEGTVTAGTFSGPANFSHVTTSTIQVTNRGWVGAASCPFGNFVEWCVTGDLGYTESIYSQSDERVKTNITPISKGMDIIDQLKPVTYQLKEYSMDSNGQLMISDKAEDQRHVGLIAQQVYNVLPDIVKRPADETTGVWSVSYNELIPVMIQAAKEQQSEIKALKSEIENIKQTLAEIKKAP